MQISQISQESLPNSKWEMVEAKDIKFSKTDQDTLEHLSNILHLFHHRNRNQHRRSLWWRHFSLFRRQLNTLLEDVVRLNEVPATHLERVRKKSRDKDTQLRISQRLDFWQTVLSTRWQNAFSQVVADGRFAVLGLVLIAVLAQLCQITGITVALEDLAQVEVEKVLHQFGKEHWQDEVEHDAEREGPAEDIGEVVVRNVVQSEELNAQSLEEVPFKGASDITEKRKMPAKASMSAKEKRKKGNAIDDLFSSLD